MFFSYYSFWDALLWTIGLLAYSCVEIKWEMKKEKDDLVKQEKYIDDEVARRLELLRDSD